MRLWCITIIKALNYPELLIDTGSSSTILKLNLVEEIGLTVELEDVLETISGVGGSEFVFFKTVDAIEVNGFKIENFQVDIGTMNYGINIDGIIGMDFLLKAKGIIDLNDLTLICGNARSVDLRITKYSRFGPFGPRSARSMSK